ncbi:hypothetical protein AOT83_19015 [Mycobacteroides sp. H001]|nr:hypothetical protein AOT86_11435 [Mycobacteroides sp. H072]KRQ32621.1 hypothetical protein AOT84_20705 [Mycobacteroides sp. H002]KRQ54047.1 hypothetical protein AOT85_05205 [Mycobacteroides sp. H054]KRQ68014.1 hypothetical protein AOT83_19015 [Mycobacteroides sp. H001]OHU42832.1 hypothetical protein BKG79_02210 [Mycobacteroides chelonae]
MLVWIRLALAPWPIQWLAYSALIFIAAGVPVAIINREDEQGQWLGWWIGIAVVALVVGLVWALAARSRAPQLYQAFDGLTPAQYRQASKAVLSGPIPADPTIRRAAARLAQNTIDRQLRMMTPVVRKFLIGSMAVNVLIQVGISATGATISFVTVYNAAIFAGMAVFWWLYPPLLEARAQLLADARRTPNIGIAAPPTQWSHAAPDAHRYQGQPEGTYSPPQV